MKHLDKWWGRATITRVDTHVYFTAAILYKWRDENTNHKSVFCPQGAVAIECFRQLVRRRVISEIEKAPPQDGNFFQEEQYAHLSELVGEYQGLVSTTDETRQPRDDLFFQVNVNLIRSDDVVFDLLFLGYKYPFENVRMPVEAFHEFIDRLKPRLRLNTIHGARKTKAFIAHASENKEFVRRLANDLISRGILVWFDEWEIKVGDSIVSKVNDGIRSSGSMIVVLSSDSVAKPWVKEEINAGLVKSLQQKAVYLLPVLLEQCDMPPLLKDKRYADFSSSYEDGLAELLKAL